MTGTVFDTNVLASGFLGALIETSTPGELLRRWYRQEFQLIVSEPILSELERTFEEPYFAGRLSASQRAADLLLLRRQALVTPLTITVRGVATHPEDDLVLATAISGRAEYLVSGDRRLRERVPEYQKVQLLSPRQFLDFLQSQSE